MARHAASTAAGSIAPQIQMYQIYPGMIGNSPSGLARLADAFLLASVGCLFTYNNQIGLNLIGCHDIVVSANHFEENQDALQHTDGFDLCTLNGKPQEAVFCCRADTCGLPLNETRVRLV